MRIYVVEDEVFQLEDMMITLEELGHECAGSGAEPLDILEELEDIDVDAVLMDIHLPEERQGIKLARKIKAMYQLPIIFTSSDQSEEVIKAASDIEPLSYLVKPIKKEDLRAALILLDSKPAATSAKVISTSFFVKRGSKLVKVETSDILYAFTDSKNYTSFVSKDGSKHTIRKSISGFLAGLDPTYFMQVHKSSAVNLAHLQYFNEADQVVGFPNGQEIGVGRSYKKALTSRINIL